VRKSPLQTGMLGVLIATIWMAAGVGAQVTAGQARAAQPVATQASASPSSAPPAAASSTAAAQTAPAAASSGAGRRDPFRPLVVKGKSDELPARLPPGKAGLVIGQLAVQGIVRGLGGQWIAVVDNKTKRAYFLYAGDELYNGTVSRITENNVVFEERVTDQMGRPRTREVVKPLAPN